MDEQEIWNRYRQVNPIAESYEAWCFCNGGKVADKLADLVIKGLKTATSSAHQLYQIEKTPIPPVGEFDIILNAKNEAVCIIRITDVTIRRFCDVTSEHAYKEGEGDRSLNYWKEVHREFFSKELEEKGLHFDENMLVVCETFVVEFV